MSGRLTPGGSWTQAGTPSHCHYNGGTAAVYLLKDFAERSQEVELGEAARAAAPQLL